MNLNSGAERADKTQQDLTAQRPLAEGEQDTSNRQHPEAQSTPYPGLDLAERYKTLTLQMLEISTFLRNRPRIDDRTIGRGELETTPRRFLGFYEAN